jgi:carbon-monoxide dehydrogenase small subunit
MLIKTDVNGRKYERDCPDHWTLSRFLREAVGLTGTKEGCGAGECGACTVLLNGNPVNSCLVLAVEADGAEVETIEGEARGGVLSDLQAALLKHHAVQCGFCTPGMVMTLRSFLRKHPRPTRHEIEEAIEGNFCRCTGYKQIVEAVLDVTGQLKEPMEVRHA